MQLLWSIRLDISKSFALKMEGSINARNVLPYTKKDYKTLPAKLLVDIFKTTTCGFLLMQDEREKIKINITAKTIKHQYNNWWNIYVRNILTSSSIVYSVWENFAIIKVSII